ncbi:MAG TPA: hypothetical protein VEX41_00910 [Candidatus Eisenbacteria bacterium]|nr:hypothetical protein [Candidatus Eisenbacteria bacterium]
MTLLGRDVGEIEALVTDRYLDALLAGPDRNLPAGPPARRPRLGRAVGSIDDAVRLVSSRLADDLPRFHPSFRFEERLALQLAEVAAALRLPATAGSAREGAAAPTRIVTLEPDPLAAPVDDEGDEGFGDGSLVARPILIGGAVAASAISLAGAAWLAWRRRSSGAAFGRAARAAHARRPLRARARLARARPSVRG